VQRAPTAVVDMSPSSESCRSMPRPYAGPSGHSVADVGWHRKGFPSSVLPRPSRLGLRGRSATSWRGRCSPQLCLRRGRPTWTPVGPGSALSANAVDPFGHPTMSSSGSKSTGAPAPTGTPRSRRRCRVRPATSNSLRRWRTTPAGRTRRTSPCTPPIGSRASLRNDRRESGPDGSPVVLRWWVSPGWVRSGGRALGILARRVTDPERRSDKAATHGTTSADRRPHRGADRPA